MLLMTNWRQQIDDVIKAQGFEKKIPDLSQSDFDAIQEFLDQKARAAFENICDQLNTFQNIRADVVEAKSLIHPTITAFELLVYKMSQPKLTYRLHFARRQEGLYAFGEYSTPNIYGENTRFHKTGLERLISHIWEDDIATDFSGVLGTKF
ncbi:hypothetical protein SAMN05444008_110136 [Cnuella takakiae]|uniref:Uncharacterized protein n=2 Tax=Cnuella takakiae TaxID=1302690 RepID=A0A1M5D9V0_9BACT|nr:hypothetical protein SAMN05444008_110136 [Cnuella takakiae]